MTKVGLAFVAVAAACLAGCASSEEAAVDNLQNESAEAASNISQLAAEIPNAELANVAVNEASDLTNAQQALTNAE
jgi:uncharacterized protein YcfL